MTGAYLNLNSNLTPEQEAALEDHRLIEGLRAADESAYEELIQRFQTPVYNLAWRLLNDPAKRGRFMSAVARSIDDYFSAQTRLAAR